MVSMRGTSLPDMCYMISMHGRGFYADMNSVALREMYIHMIDDDSMIVLLK